MQQDRNVDVNQRNVILRVDVIAAHVKQYVAHTDGRVGTVVGPPEHRFGGQTPLIHVKAAQVRSC